VALAGSGVGDVRLYVWEMLAWLLVDSFVAQLLVESSKVGIATCTSVVEGAV
jgi:hypothetical protein